VKIPLYKPGCRRENNLDVGLKGIVSECGDWIELVFVSGRRCFIVNTTVNIWVPRKIINYFTNCATIGFSIVTLIHEIR
jgi:hypothetical protein